MARTTDAAVQGIIDHDATISLTPFIEIANDLVTDLCTDSGYTAAKLELIERWLSAHFYHILDPQVVSEKAGPVGVNYQQKVDLGFNQTRYGQQAMRIDTAGNLAALDKRAKEGSLDPVQFFWAGTGNTDGDDTST